MQGQQEPNVMHWFIQTIQWASIVLICITYMAFLNYKMNVDYK